MVSLKFAHDRSEILRGRNIAVVGASRGRDSRAYAVYTALKQTGYTVYAVDPDADEIDGDPVYPHLDNVPGKIDCVVTAGSPEVTYEIVRQAGRLHIPHVWMQPGSESASAIIEAQALGIGAVYGGQCIMAEAARHPAERPAPSAGRGRRDVGAARQSA